jgi:integrase/recombinase XerD
MDELFKNISSNDLDKLRLLLSIIPQAEPKEVVTLRVFIEEYKNIIQHNRSSSYLRSVVVALNYLVEYFSLTEHRPGLQKPIASINIKDVENFLIHLQQKVSKGYIVYYRNLKAAFNKAKDWGYVKENYFTKVKLPKRQKLAPVFINSEQLLAICSQIKNKMVKDVVVFAFYTGMRLDEIVNLRWKNVDLQNRTITVGDESFTTKGRNQRFIPMSEEALASLLSQRERKNFTVNVLPFDFAHGFVFCKENGEKFTGNYFSRRFKKACTASGIEKEIHFHSLRHSFASNLVQKGVPLYSIKELLGHSSISTTEIYSHLNMDSLREAVKKLDVKSEKREEEPPLSLGHLPLGKRENSQPKIFRINSAEK